MEPKKAQIEKASFKPPVNAVQVKDTGKLLGRKVSKTAEKDPIAPKTLEEFQKLTLEERRDLTKKVVDSGLPGFRAIEISSASGAAVRKIIATNEALGDVEVVVAFQKQTPSDQPAQYMEKIMYDLAGIVGMGDMFAPTLADEKGSIQAPISGMSLLEFFAKFDQDALPEGQKTPEMPALIDATLATTVFGMFDAHANNIFVTQDGNLKFFDNTRSMPHSNNFVINRGAVFPSYRSGTFLHPYSFRKLRDNDVEKIKEKISEIKAKVPEIEKYLNESSVQNQLPIGWFDAKLSLAAMRERIENMEKALESQDVHLYDLIFAANPDYKFQLLLHFAVTDPSTMEVLKDCEGDDIEQFLPGVADQVGVFSIFNLKRTGLLGRSKTIKTSDHTYHIDPEVVWEIAHDDSLSLIEGVKKVSSHVAANRDSSDIDLEEIENHIEEISARVYSQAHLDNKDVKAENAQRYFLLYLEKDVNYPENKKWALSKLKENPEEVIFSAESKEGGYSLKAYYNKGDKVAEEMLDYESEPGKIKYPDWKMAPLVPKLFRSLVQIKKLPYFHETLTPQLLSKAKEKGGYCLTLGDKPETVILHRYNSKGEDKPLTLTLSDKPRVFGSDKGEVRLEDLLTPLEGIPPIL